MLSDALCKAIPAPETTPSLIAAFVAQIASSTRSFFSFNSTSEFAPTFTTAILADSLASLFSSLTISLGRFVFNKSFLILSITSLTCYVISLT